MSCLLLLGMQEGKAKGPLKKHYIHSSTDGTTIEGPISQVEDARGWQQYRVSTKQVN